MAAKTKEDRLDFGTSRLETEQLPSQIAAMIRTADFQRSNFQRRWYDNNLFDDGYHFRYVERATNRIVDNSRQLGAGPLRAIPKASRQIRGVANLLMSSDPTPVVYPEKLTKSNYADKPEEYEQAKEQAKDAAKKIGHWIQEEWKDQDMMGKLANMILLAAKHGISYMQVWPDAVEEDIRTRVYDAFDIRVVGTVKHLEDAPFLIKSTPQFVSKIKANELYDVGQVQKLTPDNRLASSELKEAYMSRRFGRDRGGDESASILLHEAFIKEYLNADIRKRIQTGQGNSDLVLKDKKDGDPIIRHVFMAGGVWLLDEYLNISRYPFVDMRLEPGHLYQVPLIERFIPANKSLDVVVSRIERYTNSMTAGIWMKRRGEQFNISNKAGGQIIEYENTPPVQGNMAPIPAHVFQFINILNEHIEEQGVTTSALGKIPSGVKSGKAIESLKESEFANLIIANRMLTSTVKRITERFLDIAHDYFITPQTVQILDKGEPDYFDIIGQAGIDAREKARIPPSDAIPVKREYKVDIEVQNGLGFTREGQIARAQDLSQFMLQLAEAGVIQPQVVQVFVKQLLEVYQFGSISEIMDAIDESGAKDDLSDEQLEKIKLAVLEVMKDIEQQKGSEQSQQQGRIDETKLGVGEAIQDIQKAQGTGGEQQQGEEEKPPSRSISFKDLPPEGQSQLAAQAGIQITPAQAAAASAKEKGSGT